MRQVWITLMAGSSLGVPSAPTCHAFQCQGLVAAALCPSTCISVSPSDLWLSWPPQLLQVIGTHGLLKRT